MVDRPARSGKRARRVPTLREVAERAGVHLSTVSRVMREPEPPDGWSETAERVRRVADEMGYRTNPWAASLRTRRTTTIGVVMPRLTDGVVATMFQGIEEAATAAGYSVLLTSPPDDLEAQRRSIEFLVSRQVDGLILSSLHRPGQEFVDSLRLRDLPLILVNRHADTDLPSVTGDDRRGGYLAGRHLLDLGHRQLGLVAGPEHASTAHDRVLGFLDALAEEGIDLAPERIIGSGFEVSSGAGAAHRLLDTDDRPTAIFAIDDTAAIGVMGVARKLGLRVPDDLAVVGYNDIPLIEHLPIPLTTIRSPAREIGATAVRSLIDLIDGTPVESTVLPVSVVERLSTRPPVVQPS